MSEFKFQISSKRVLGFSGVELKFPPNKECPQMFWTVYKNACNNKNTE